jgi:hypothetical protein
VDPCGVSVSGPHGEFLSLLGCSDEPKMRFLKVIAWSAARRPHGPPYTQKMRKRSLLKK